MSNNIEIYPPTTKVNIGGNDTIEATIQSVWIDNLNIKYKCSWWSGKDRKEDWFYESELDPIDQNKMVKIGFK